MFKALLFLSIYLPFQLALNPIKGVDLASIRVIILVLFFIWLVVSLKNKKIIIKNNFQTVLVLTFLFLNIFSCFFSRNIDWSTRKILYLLSIFPIYFIASTVLKDREKIVKISRGFVFSGTIVAFLGIIQFALQFVFGIDKTYKLWSYYVLSPFLGNSFLEMVLAYPSWLVNISGKTIFRAISIFPDPHTFSFFLGILLPISFGLWLNDKKKYWLVSFSFLLLANILTFSRGGYLSLLAGILILFFVYWNKIKNKYKIGVILFLITVIFILITSNPISSRFFSSFNFREGSNMGRIEMWEKSISVIRDNFIFGVGIGNFPLQIKPLANYREPIYAHNTYLDITVEAGFLAGLSWIGILFFSMFNFFKKNKKDLLYGCFLLSVIIFSVHSLVDNAIYSPIVLTLFLIIISFAYADEDKKIY